MRQHKSSLVSDVTFILFILACIVNVIFVSSDPNLYSYNILLLNTSFLFAIITYFTTLMTGLIINLLFVFGYGSYTLYQTAIVGATVGLQNYFWLFMTPLITILVYLFTLGNRKLQQENEELKEVRSKHLTIDEQTQFKNILSFEQDLQTFMALSVRYKIPLTLLIMQVKYWDDVKRLISTDKVSDVLLELSQISHSLVRSNDTLYLLNNENPTWGFVLFTDEEGSQIVVSRLKETLELINKDNFKAKYKINLHLKIGTTVYDEYLTPTPYEFINQAKKTLEFDV